MLGLLDCTVWQVFWTLLCVRSFGLYSVAGLLDSTLWKAFWTVQSGQVFWTLVWQAVRVDLLL